MLEQVTFDMVGLVDMFLRQDGRACRHAANQGQCQLGQAGQGQRKLHAAAGCVEGAQAVTAQTDAA